MSSKRLSERTRDRFVFLCSYIEDILIIVGLISIVIAGYLTDLRLGLCVQGLVLIYIGFVLSKILK